MKYPHLETKLATLKTENAFRKSRTFKATTHFIRDTDNTNCPQLINFSSNDYLGLASNQDLQMEFFQQTDVDKHHWMSSSSSRSLTGTSSSHKNLEIDIAKSYGKSNALIFNSGYHANTGILPSITDNNDLIIADKLVHASLIDGLKLGQSTFKRFNHNDLNHLRLLLKKNRHSYRNVWIVTESLFSMDGDFAPLTELIQLKNEFQCSLYLDEAHAIGCLGENGLGLSDQVGVTNDIDLIVGTFGKALASCGGFATGDQVLIDSIINFSRSWLYSTALPPINIDWNIFIWNKLNEFTEQRQQLTTLTEIFTQGLSAQNKHFLGDSFIIPVIASGNDNVANLSDNLNIKGILAMPIRSPTVKLGSERIRFSLTANMPTSAITQCIDALNDL